MERRLEPPRLEGARAIGALAHLRSGTTAAMDPPFGVVAEAEVGERCDGDVWDVSSSSMET